MKRKERDNFEVHKSHVVVRVAFWLIDLYFVAALTVKMFGQLFKRGRGN